MDWGGSPAVRALRRAQAVSAYARRTGCGIDEAAGALANPDLANPDLANPDLANPDLPNPALANPDLAERDLAGPARRNLGRTGCGPADRAGVSRRALL